MTDMYKETEYFVKKLFKTQFPDMRVGELFRSEEDKTLLVFSCMGKKTYYVTITLSDYKDGKRAIRVSGTPTEEKDSATWDFFINPVSLDSTYCVTKEAEYRFASKLTLWESKFPNITPNIDDVILYHWKRRSDYEG